MFVKFVFLGSEVCWEGVCATQHLEHVLVEILFGFLVISEPFQDQLAEICEVNQTLSTGIYQLISQFFNICIHITWQYCLGCLQLLVLMGSVPTSSLLDANPKKDRSYKLFKNKDETNFELIFFKLET